jgi:hypothetical protein
MDKPQKTKGKWQTSKTKDVGVTKKEFFRILDKASQPINKVKEVEENEKG